MDKVWADKWVKALRSGEYKKGKGALRIDDKYCCLGVLCEVAGEKFVGLSKMPDASETVYGVIETDQNNPGAFDHHQATFLPHHVKEKVGMRTVNGVYGRRAMNTLVSLNDTSESFDTIADTIEKNWEKL